MVRLQESPVGDNCMVRNEWICPEYVTSRAELLTDALALFRGQPFADFAFDGVTEECELRGSFGFMAYHGGGLEETTDVVARAAAARRLVSSPSRRWGKRR